VCDHLTMNGVMRWVLYDPDRLGPENLVKHPRQRSNLGNLKVDIQRDWILDRNPEAEVRAVGEDVFESLQFRNDVADSDLILCCADKRSVRLFVNSIAVGFRKPCVTASVYREGFGGEVYAYLPGATGCFECMERAADSLGLNIEEVVKPTDEEQQQIYGLGLEEFQASGLSLDIQAISILQARLALDILLHDAPRKPAPVPANWLIHYNRPVISLSKSSHSKTIKLKVKPHRECQCADMSH
jgi:molybdopterin/thiamine biosynthesis adenylyltransferase